MRAVVMRPPTYPHALRERGPRRRPRRVVPVQNLPCPEWCTTAHNREEEELIGSRDHYGDVLRIPAVTGENGHSEVVVDLMAIDDLEAGVRSSTDVGVQGLDPAPPAIVRQAMVAIELALRLAEK